MKTEFSIFLSPLYSAFKYKSVEAVIYIVLILLLLEVSVES